MRSLWRCKHYDVFKLLIKLKRQMFPVCNYSCYNVRTTRIRTDILCEISDLVHTLELLIYLSYQLINSFIYSLFNSLIVCFFVYIYIFWCEQCHSFHNSIFLQIWDSRFFFMIKTASLTNIKKCSQITSYLKVEMGNG